MAYREAQGFTLVELLVVIIIIGILAAVAIPQFGDASLDAKRSALNDDLRELRSAIDRYYLEHTGVYPGVVRTHKATGSGSAAAHGDAEEAFVKQMTSYSDAAGNTCDEKSAGFPHGPYVKGSIPNNPLPAATAEEDPGRVNVTKETGPLSADAKPATGWKYSSQTGEIIANNREYAGPGEPVPLPKPRPLPGPGPVTEPVTGSVTEPVVPK